MAEYKTPGVYVEEISKFPPSVAGVATAIPAFIGVTSNCPSKQPIKIKSLLDFENMFGVGPKLTLDNTGKLQNHNFVLYDSIRLFYDNGGGICYVVSIGTYEDYKQSKPQWDKQYAPALDTLKKIDEVTLLLAPDAAMLLDASSLGSLHKLMLQQCADLGDRFAILDARKDDSLDKDMETFRNNVGNNHLSYGAAYYPFLRTNYTKDICFDEMLKIAAIKAGAEKIDQYNNYYAKTNDKTAFGVIKERLQDKKLKELNEEIKALEAEIANLKDNKEEKSKKEAEKKLKEEERNNADGKKYNDELEKFSIHTDGKNILYLGKVINEKTFVDNAIGKEVYDKILLEFDEIKAKKPLMAKAFAAQIEGYEEMLAALQAQASIIPPSGAIAGIYAANDGNKGVWQAPANVSVASVADVTELISDKDQENMNVDANTGKSVNAIRFFTGKGILVWGARTLDGNSNEWRYVPVRRLFNYVEESVQKSTAWAVFQPNDANTWVKVQCQIENFLNNLWRDGALAGSTPDKAYYVKVGLDVTMTADDINRGYLIVEIGLAAVRPAEFIVLKFSHKVQEA